VLEDVLVDGAKKLGITLGEEELAKFSTYTDLLLEWNEKLNLTRITDPDEIAIKHYLDSLTCLKAAKFRKGDIVADIGTGAGFPGVPLAIVRPDIKVVLIDATRKRLVFLKEVQEALEVLSEDGESNIELVQARAEEVGRQSEHREHYNIVVARAVAEMRILVEYCLPLVKPGGVFIAMKGPDVEGELALARPGTGTLGGEKPEIMHLTLPGTNIARNLITIKKIKPTPEQFPRHGSKIATKPL
jgi:16S rRNA (guanine527-N7)-methyltransferase